MAELVAYGVRLHYSDVGKGRPLVFIHGWCADNTSFRKQIDHLATSHRCISVDLPGHGKSAKPHIDLTIVFLAEIIGRFIHELKLDAPILIGHSMGGAVALEILHQSPECAAGCILVDPSPIVAHKPVINSMKTSLRKLEESELPKIFNEMAVRFMFFKSDPKGLLSHAQKCMNQVPRESAISAWKGMLDWYGKPALQAASEKPLAYIASNHPSNDRTSIVKNAPKIMWAEPLEASHHLHQSVPEQVNVMIEHFLKVTNRK
ncbi:hypothetical protein GCM10017044_14830 [Kordiimonas sediminis]|uniref:AB hydrolase-1 domain-containing protein n=1 Tax=Kordiimonas sediminis TaxID=1735581 RepID=A0A919E7R6_9PROT|nr:alpha/beta hydrolase [Kordiimonas sediminis]GHF20946.1 hypothetical protein GCM10017044_14830 [Kordiimonas sediminis]